MTGSHQDDDVTRQMRLRRELLNLVRASQPPQGAWQIAEFVNHFQNRYEQDEVGEAASALFASGLLGWAGYQGVPIRLLATSSVRATTTKAPTLPEAIQVIWDEAAACLPGRPRAAVLLLGVAAEMTVEQLAEFLFEELPNPNRELRAWQIATRRAACIQALRSEGMSTLKLTEDLVRSAVAALKSFEAIGWARDEAMHREPERLPDTNSTYITLVSFPPMAERVLRCTSGKRAIRS